MSDFKHGHAQQNACPTFGKIRYETHTEALAAANAMHKRRYVSDYRGYNETFRCDRCLGYHIGHRIGGEKDLSAKERKKLIKLRRKTAYLNEKRSMAEEEE